MGNYHTCAYLTGGTLKCWGNRSAGQVGDGTTSRNALKTPTTIDVGGEVGLLSLGGSHTCAYLTSGTLKCWGEGAVGQLGDGTATNRNTPTPVDVGGSIEVMSLGMSQSCAYLTGGTLKCWGQNHYGQLGDGTSKNRNRPTTPQSCGILL